MAGWQACQRLRFSSVFQRHFLCQLENAGLRSRSGGSEECDPVAEPQRAPSMLSLNLVLDSFATVQQGVVVKHGQACCGRRAGAKSKGKHRVAPVAQEFGAENFHAQGSGFE